MNIFKLVVSKSNDLYDIHNEEVSFRSCKSRRFMLYLNQKFMAESTSLSSVLKFILSKDENLDEYERSMLNGRIAFAEKEEKEECQKMSKSL